MGITCPPAHHRPSSTVLLWCHLKTTCHPYCMISAQLRYTVHHQRQLHLLPTTAHPLPFIITTMDRLHGIHLMLFQVHQHRFIPQPLWRDQPLNRSIMSWSHLDSPLVDQLEPFHSHHPHSHPTIRQYRRQQGHPLTPVSQYSIGIRFTITNRIKFTNRHMAINWTMDRMGSATGTHRNSPIMMGFRQQPMDSDTSCQGNITRRTIEIHSEEMAASVTSIHLVSEG